MFKKLKIYIYALVALTTLTACQTVTNKIDKTTELEKKELSKWLNKSEESLKSFYGQPDKVEFLKTRNRNYVYFTKKYKIKCERKFEIDSSNIVVGFSSKNCF
jgi:phage-related protein